MFSTWPQRSVGMLGMVPEVKQEGDIFLEEIETVLASRPLKFLFVDEVTFCTLVYFPQLPFIDTREKKEEDSAWTSNLRHTIKKLVDLHNFSLLAVRC